ncbi:MAG TPA: DUF1499 domain-containing protein [Acetobacteraceae bacterium]|jgi:uncharacterized protein (DUF1499 family)|nr:DUF1499 domain-containing protein [Acetobacteraceae bacterium]
MNPIAWLVSLVLPACGFPAAEGLPTPPLMDVTQIVRPASPNTALAAPAGFNPSPDLVTPPYALQADRLFALVLDVATNQPRTYPAARYPDQLQAHYVARSAVFNFPDLIMIQVVPTGPGSSSLIVYSRSVYGQSDLGVNRKRLDTWLAALNTKVPPSSER